MDFFISAKNKVNICRVCLTPSKNLRLLSDPIREKVKNLKEHYPIYFMLEEITSSKVILDEKKFPINICRMCFTLLKISYEFQTEFLESQRRLEQVVEEKSLVRRNNKDENEDPILEEKNEATTASVELIVGRNKFDLNDILIVEDEKKEKCSYEGFLRNLGSEISAKFVNNKKNISNRLPFPRKKHTYIIDKTVKQRNNLERTRPENVDMLDPDIEKSQICVETIVDNEDFNSLVKTIYPCPKCEKLLSSRSSLRSHMESKHQENCQIYICDKCGHIANTKAQLRHHLTKHNGKIFACEFCDKAYAEMSHLKVHLAIHKNERKYLCSFCGKNFNYATSLTYHMRIHTEKPYACDICDQKFTMAQTLKRHLRTHTKEKPFPCSYCAKHFASKLEQKSHEMIHTGERPYSCKYCGKGYIKPVNLHIHCLKHPGPHECHLCDRTFVEMKFLKLHLKRSHKDYLEDFELHVMTEL